MASSNNDDPDISSSRQTQPFEVFYDGDCPMCKREIDMIRRYDKLNRVVLTNLADSAFDVDDIGKPMDVLMREIHGRYADGTVITGVDVFREIYQRIGWSKLVGFSRLPGVRWLMDCGYRYFAHWRYRSAMKRIQRQGCKVNIANDSSAKASSVRVTVD